MTSRRNFLTMLGLAPIAVTTMAFGKSEIMLDDARRGGKTERLAAEDILRNKITDTYNRTKHEWSVIRYAGAD